MTMRPWIPVLTGVVLLLSLLFVAVDRAWGQPKCAPGVIYRCAQPVATEKCCGWSADGVCDCRPACGPCDECRQKKCGKTESACSARIAQKAIPETAGKFAASEPRKLTLPRGSYKRMVSRESCQSRPVCGWPEAAACLPDCRHDTIFGTETIFGDRLLRAHGACPYGCDDAGKAISWAAVVSQLDAPLQKIFACRQDTCGDSKGKAGGERVRKSKCGKEMLGSPIMEGEPHDLRLDENPFRDDAIESPPHAPDLSPPAMSPPAPLPPAASEASRIRPQESAVELDVPRVDSAPSGAAPSLQQANSRPVGNRAPTVQTTPDCPNSRRPSALLSSFTLE